MSFPYGAVCQQVPRKGCLWLPEERFTEGEVLKLKFQQDRVLPDKQVKLAFQAEETEP
jgi:hypothetical protein